LVVFELIYLHYQVLFICTANNISNIIPPLLDRLDIIEIQGYIYDEKMQILKNFIIPKEISRIGLDQDIITISQEALDKLINLYSPEPGVRSLKKYIQRLFAKACLKMSREKLSSFKLDLQNFDEIMKESIPPPRRYFTSLPVGVSTSIIDSDYGAILQYIECFLNYGEKGEKLKSTGSIGNIITESISIAYAFSKRYLATIGDTSFFDKNSVHIHFPAGGLKKDCPSLGAAIVSSLVSLALNIPLKENIVILGEITLSGNILHVSAIKETFIEMQRQRITEMILPVANRPEWEELEASLKEGITVHFVENYQQIFSLVTVQHQKKDSYLIESETIQSQENQKPVTFV